jgi:hypothetical protein
MRIWATNGEGVHLQPGAGSWENPSRRFCWWSILLTGGLPLGGDPEPFARTFASHRRTSPLCNNAPTSIEQFSIFSHLSFVRVPPSIHILSWLGLCRVLAGSRNRPNHSLSPANQGLSRELTNVFEISIVWASEGMTSRPRTMFLVFSFLYLISHTAPCASPSLRHLLYIISCTATSHLPPIS